MGIVEFRNIEDIVRLSTKVVLYFFFFPFDLNRYFTPFTAKPLKPRLILSRIDYFCYPMQKQTKNLKI